MRLYPMGGSCVLVRSPYPRFQRAAGPTCYVTVRLVLFITRDGELISSAGVLSPNVTVNLGYFFHLVCRIDTDT